MKHAVLGLAVVCLLVSGSAFASEELAKKNNCMGCHQMDKKGIGPAFKEIAAKYKDDKDAAKKLATSIEDGSKGKWGSMAMAAQKNVSKDDAKKLADWIMSLNAAEKK